MTEGKRDNCLLTGAGFTKNFGGFLASEFHSHIFNDKRIQSSLRLRDQVQADSDFESLYQRVLDGDYTSYEKKSMHEAVVRTYEILDSAIRRIRFGSAAKNPVGRRYSKLLDVFLGQKDQTGYVFTLNQDLFLERCYWDHGGAVPLLPGLAPRELWFSTRFTESLAETERVALPSERELEKLKASFPSVGRSYYVKLHGSCNWVGSDGDDRMIIGGQKTARIAQIPMLDWYFEIFQRVLSRPNSHLLLIGYGFGDEHVNKIIAKSVSQCGLSLYILGPDSYDKVRASLDSCRNGKILLSGLRGYFPYMLAEVFPPASNAPPTNQWLDIMEIAFGFEIDERYR